MPRKQSPYHTINPRVTPQSEPIPGTVANSAGGYSFQVDRLDLAQPLPHPGHARAGRTTSVESKLTKDNADALFACIKEDGARTVQTIVDISVQGRNPKQHPVMFALAACTGAEDTVTRQAALDAIPLVCRTGSHLFLFASYVEQFRGWGRGLRNAVAKWYTERDEDDLALQVAKYQSREGWSHRDLLRLSKPGAPGRPKVERGSGRDQILAWAAGKSEGQFNDTFLNTVDTIRRGELSMDKAVGLIEQYRLPWEVLPTELLAKAEVWHALIPNLGIGALVRNLGRISPTVRSSRCRGPRRRWRLAWSTRTRCSAAGSTPSTCSPLR